jgi:hypothetical protein
MHASAVLRQRRCSRHTAIQNYLLVGSGSEAQASGPTAPSVLVLQFIAYWTLFITVAVYALRSLCCAYSLQSQFYHPRALTLSYWRHTILEALLQHEISQITSPGRRRPVVLDARNSHGLQTMCIGVATAI